MIVSGAQQNNSATHGKYKVVDASWDLYVVIKNEAGEDLNRNLFVTVSYLPSMIL